MKRTWRAQRRLVKNQQLLNECLNFDPLRASIASSLVCPPFKLLHNISSVLAKAWYAHWPTSMDTKTLLKAFFRIFFNPSPPRNTASNPLSPFQIEKPQKIKRKKKTEKNRNHWIETKDVLLKGAKVDPGRFSWGGYKKISSSGGHSWKIHSFKNYNFFFQSFQK